MAQLSALHSVRLHDILPPGAVILQPLTHHAISIRDVKQSARPPRHANAAVTCALSASEQMMLPSSGGAPPESARAAPAPGRTPARRARRARGRPGAAHCCAPRPGSAARLPPAPPARRPPALHAAGGALTSCTPQSLQPLGVPLRVQPRNAAWQIRYAIPKTNSLVTAAPGGSGSMPGLICASRACRSRRALRAAW